MQSPAVNTIYKIVFVVLVLLCSKGGIAQDLLITHTGDTISATIIEKSAVKVKYKSFGKDDGIVNELYTSELEKIVFKNGTELEFSRPKIEEPAGSNDAEDIDYYARPSHNLALNPISLFQGILNLKYEYILKSGKLGLELPLSYGFSAGYIQTGLNLNYYFLESLPGSYKIGNFIVGWGKMRYYAGPSVMLGTSSDLTMSVERVRAGFVWQLRKGFNAGASAAVGIENYYKDLVSNNNAKAAFSWNISITIGWQFMSAPDRPSSKGRGL